MTWVSAVERKKGEVNMFKPFNRCAPFDRSRTEEQVPMVPSLARFQTQSLSQFLAKEISPTGEGVNHIVKGERCRDGQRVTRASSKRTAKSSYAIPGLLLDQTPHHRKLVLEPKRQHKSNVIQGEFRRGEFETRPYWIPVFTGTTTEPLMTSSANF
jgi:hypothetical protein